MADQVLAAFANPSVRKRLQSALDAGTHRHLERLDSSVGDLSDRIHPLRQPRATSPSSAT
jgi:hypothetical protein